MKIIHLIKKHLPDTQAIYLFGSYGTDDETSKSDVDIALLLPYAAAKKQGAFYVMELHSGLESDLHRNVDLVNLRQVDVVFQKEVIMANRRIDCSDAYAADEFEMLTLSYYQQLNRERAEIIEEAIKVGQVYKP